MTEVAEDGGVAEGGQGSRGWRVVSVVGEVFITLGVVLLLAVVYEVWWTNVQADQRAEEQRDELIGSWTQAQSAPDGDVPAELAPIPSQAFGLMYIPRLRDDVWETPLIEGVSDADLANGIGHFPETVLPGEVGNTSFAGHRATNGEPLKGIDLLQPGDLVYIQTATGWYTYELREDQIVLPTDVWVVDPVPGQPGAVPQEALLTLVTCNPRWGSTERWIWWGDLVDERSQADGPPDEVLQIQGGA